MKDFTNKTSTFFLLHATVLVLGFTGILGKLISLETAELVWYRLLIATIAMFIILNIRKKKFILSRKHTLLFLGIGIIVGLHWFCFFESIKSANVSVALGCLASQSLFTSFLEPIIHKKKLLWFDVLTGIFILGGLYIIFQFETSYITGIIYGIMAAFLASLFSVLNDKHAKKEIAVNIMTFYEMLGGFIGVNILFLLMGEKLALHPSHFEGYDMVYLLILGTVCTAGAFVLIIDLIKRLGAFTVLLAINLEPVYGILAAFLIFGDSEKMTLGFYIGALIIIIAVFLHPFFSKRIQKKAAIMKA
jgi:drug/metabolite transporter (DMT)-like permease